MACPHVWGWQSGRHVCHICGKDRAVPLFERAMSGLSWPGKLALGFATVLLLGCMVVFAYPVIFGRWLPNLDDLAPLLPFFYIIVPVFIALAWTLGKFISWAIRSGRNSWE